MGNASVEVVAPVYDEAHRGTLDSILEENLNNPDAWALQPDGVYLAANWDTLGSPETYLGYARTTGFASPGSLEPDRSRDY